MGHVVDCPKPRIRRRDRDGSTWACDCGRLYRVVSRDEYYGYERTWELVKLGGAK